MLKGMLIRDAGLCDHLIQERKRKGLDLYDEVWEGMYVMPSMPNNAHQKLLDDLGDILTDIVKRRIAMRDERPHLHRPMLKKPQRAAVRGGPSVATKSSREIAGCGEKERQRGEEQLFFGETAALNHVRLQPGEKKEPRIVVAKALQQIEPEIRRAKRILPRKGGVC